MVLDRCLPPTHKKEEKNLYVWGHLSHLVCRNCENTRPEMESDAISRIAPFVGFSFFFFNLFFAVHLLHIKLMSIGNNSSCHWGFGLYVLDESAASYLSSAKVPIDWSPDCASVSLPVQPFPRPPPPCLLPLPSIHPFSYPCPRPHWSAMPWLLPTDHSAWCLLCLGEVNKLSGQSNRGLRGPEEPLNATEGQERRKTEGGRHKTDGREGRMRVVWRKQKGCFSQDFLRIVATKRLFMSLRASVGFRRWLFLAKHCCKCCKGPGRREVDESAEAQSNYRSDSRKRLFLTPKRVEVEKLLLKSWKAPYKAGLFIWEKTKQNLCRGEKHW